MESEERYLQRLDAFLSRYVEPLTTRVERLEKEIRNGLHAQMAEIVATVRVIGLKVDAIEKQEGRRWDVWRMVLQSLIAVIITLALGGMVALVTRGAIVQMAENVAQVAK